jgi:probable phosphoglycerate mutase
VIPKKEFYFLRHGQTDYNLNQIKVDHPPHILLNETGKSQALGVEPLVAELPIKAICYSPMRRAVQTKEIVASRIRVPEFEVPDLSECSALIWQQLSPLAPKDLIAAKEPLAGFVGCVLRGFQRALSYDAPVLIVSHGGVHKVLSLLLDIAGHPGLIDNCALFHFAHQQGVWEATKIINTN